MHNETDPAYVQEFVGDYENVRGLTGAEGEFYGYFIRVPTGISNSIILREREISREVRRYADILRENIGRPLGQQKQIISNLSVSSKYIFTGLCLSLADCIQCLNGMAGPSVQSCLNTACRPVIDFRSLFMGLPLYAAGTSFSSSQSEMFAPPPKNPEG